MIFYDSVCFEITAFGEKAKVEPFVNYIKSGGLDDFFPFDDDLLFLDDNYETVNPKTEVRVIFSSDEFGIEVESFDSDEFLEMLCKVGKALQITGTFYNFDDDEIRFVSNAGDDYYISGSSLGIFGDELDSDEDGEDDEEEPEF